MQAKELQRYLRSLNEGWMDLQATVDTFKAGNPKTEVAGIAVAWMSTMAALKKALDLGCNVFITHEPTYYNHHDKNKEIFRFESVRKKRRLIENSGITIIRCHDVWDQYPEIGIPTAWGKLLDLGEPIDGGGYYYVYDGKGRRAEDVARQIAARTSHLGQPGVQLIGPGDKPVHRIVLGTGAITRFFSFLEDLKADLALCSDDGFTYWRDGAFAIDAGIPVVVVNHPVSEDHGMKLLAGHLTQQFPTVPVHHIQEQCMFRIING